MSATRVPPAPDAPFFTPAQQPAAGTALTENPPTLFKPITIRGLTLQNRIWVAPMCTYSAQDGHLSPWHLVHLGQIAQRGASLTLVEATGVLPNGRITPYCAGLWKDSQIEPLKKVVDYVHSQGQKIGIQLAHAGRKASTVPPWMYKGRGQAVVVPEEDGGFPNDVMGPSAIGWGTGHVEKPREMTADDIQLVKNAFRDAAVRALKAGVDTIEIHAAHGYLFSSFLSPLSNKRTDNYGGSFENRIRLLLETIQEVRAVIPKDMPLLLRVSCTEWMEHTGQPSWTVEDTIELAKRLPALGVDLLDVSSGGNSEAQSVPIFNDKQPAIAGRIRKELRKAGISNLLIGAVGMITQAELARELVERADDSQDGLIEVESEQGMLAKADVVLIGRQFLREPEWVLKVAHQLNVDVKWPVQYGYAAKFRTPNERL